MSGSEFSQGPWGGLPDSLPGVPDFVQPEPERILSPEELKEMLNAEGPKPVEEASEVQSWAMPEFEDDDEDEEASPATAAVDEAAMATRGLRTATEEPSAKPEAPREYHEPDDLKPVPPAVSHEANDESGQQPGQEVVEQLLIKPVVEIHDAEVELPAVSEPDVVMVDAHEIPLDERAALSPKMAIAARSEQTRDGAEYHALAGHVARLSDLNQTQPLPNGMAAVGRKIYILDTGVPGAPSMPDDLLGSWAKVVKLDIMAPDGILSSLGVEQLAELFATAANHEDPRAAIMSKDLMYTVIEKLKEFSDPRTGDPRTGLPTMYEVRDAIRIMRGARQMPLSGIFEAPTMSPEMETAIKDAFVMSSQDSLVTYFEMLRVLITEVVGRDTPEEYRVNEVPLSKRRDLTAQHDEEMSRPAPGGVTVISTSVNAKGKLGHWAQTMIGASAASAAVSNAPLSVGLFVVRNLDEAPDMPGVKFALDKARSLHIPTLVTTKVTEQVLPALVDSDLMLGKLSGPQAEMIAPYTGIRTRTDVSGKSTGTSGTTGSGGHQSDSDNFRDIPAVGGRMEPNKESTGISKTNDASYNHALNDGRSATVGPGPNIRADENGKLDPLEVSIIDAGGTHAYSVRTTEYTREFPPKHDEDFGTTEADKIRKVEARVKADLRISETGKVVGLQAPKHVPEIMADVERPKHSGRVAEPHQHAQEHGMRYDRYVRQMEASRQKPDDWRKWIDREHARQISQYHSEWRRLREVDPATMPFEQWVHGEQSLRVWAERHGVLNNGLRRYIDGQLQTATQAQLPRGRYLP